MDGWPIVVITATAMCVGLFGTIVPVVPGLALSLAAMVLYGVVSGFGSYGLVAVAVGAALFAFGTYLGVRIPRNTRQRPVSGARIRPSPSSSA